MLKSFTYKQNGTVKFSQILHISLIFFGTSLWFNFKKRKVVNEDGLEVIEITDISYEAFTNCFRHEYGDKVAESYSYKWIFWTLCCSWLKMEQNWPYMLIRRNK